MRKFVFAALVAALCVVASPSSAKVIVSDSLRVSTLAVSGRDSTAVINVENAARMWLTIQAVIPAAANDTTGAGAFACAPIRLALQVREHLTSRAATDSLWETWVSMGLTAADSLRYRRQRLQEPAAFSESTFVAWVPRAYTAAAASAGSAAVDTVSIGNIKRGATTAGSDEIVVVIPTKVGVYSNSRSARVDLYDRATGMPFSAKYASFAYRVLAGPTSSKFRVVLHREVW